MQLEQTTNSSQTAQQSTSGNQQQVSTDFVGINYLFEDKG
jgi:hypothetical protein